MKLSAEALETLKGLEGYHKARSDGSCEAYRCVVGKDGKGNPVYDGKWTIGWGCTKGVKAGMVWTKEEAETALRAELEDCERIVTRLVTVDINQHQFEACVLFVFNVGEGGGRDPKTGKVTDGFKTSTLLRKLNAGDFERAAEQFGRWTGSGGVKNVPGLVRRRKIEAALFLQPMEGEDATEPDMPQTIEAPLPIDWTEAHETLKQASGLYNANRLTVKSLVGGIGGAVYWAWDHAVEIACAGLVCVIVLVFLQHVSRQLLTRRTA